MKFLQRKRQERLYKQWTQHAELPPEAIPLPERPIDEAPTLEVPTDIKEWGKERSWFYLFRISILNIVRKILRVNWPS
jgi:hypothetical protein